MSSKICTRRLWLSATTSRPLSNPCQSVVHAMDCFDTGQDTHLVFETEARCVQLSRIHVDAHGRQ